MAARIETNSFQSKSRQADPSHWLNRATFCMVHSMIFIVLLNCMFFDDNWMPCGCFLVWNCSPKDFLPMTFQGRPRPQRQGWSLEDLGANGWTGTRSRRVLGSSGRRGPGFLGEFTMDLLLGPGDYLLIPLLIYQVGWYGLFTEALG